MSSRSSTSSLLYLASVYPAVSHTFIQREVLALRRLGMRVHTAGLRRSGPADVLTDLDRDEYAQTRAVRPASIVSLARVHLRALARAPARYLATAVSAVREGTGLRDRLRRLGYFAQAAVVRQWCTELGAKHVHAHFERPAADVAMLAARLAGGRGGLSWSFTAHRPEGYLDDRRGLARRVREATFVVCVSHYGRAQLIGLSGRDCWEKLHVVRCGIDPDLFVRERPHAPAASRILTVARLAPVKGHGVLLQALAQLRDAGVSVHATIVGDGSQRRALEERAEELGLGRAIEFTGSLGQDVIRERYRSADVFCLPSFDEGVPVVLMEAMAMELPVVATCVAGVPELVQNGRSGVLVAAGSADALAGALRDVLECDEDRRAQMGAAGRERVREQFDCERSAEQLRDLFARYASV